MVDRELTAERTREFEGGRDDVQPSVRQFSSAAPVQHRGRESDIPVSVSEVGCLQEEPSRATDCGYGVRD